MLDPAPSPEGGRGSAFAFRYPKNAQGDGRTVRRAFESCGLPQRGYGRAYRQRRGQNRRELLFPRNEYPPAGGASGNRGDHRRRPCRANDTRCSGRKAGHDARRCRYRRLGDREPCLCRRSLPRLPAFDRASRTLPAAGRALDRRRRSERPPRPAWRAGRRWRLRGRRGVDVLRPDDRQAGDLGQDPRRGGRSAGRGARCVPDRRARAQCRFPQRDHAARAVPLGRTDHGVHRRGISRRLHRCARFAAIDQGAGSGRRCHRHCRCRSRTAGRRPAFR